MDRRTFIKSGVAALAAAGLAACNRDTRGSQPRSSEDDNSLPSAPLLKADPFNSRYVRSPVGYVAARPPGVPNAKPLPVVFCLPGRGGTAAGQAAGSLPETLWDEIAHDRVPPYGLVFVDGGESYWHERTSGEDRLSMLVREVVPMVADRFALGRRRPRGVIGWSMGGYGALLAAETFPKVFSAVAAASPAVWPTYEAMMAGPGDAFDSAADFTAHDVFAGIDRLADTAVRIDCGEEDPFYWYVKQFVDSFPPGDEPEGGFSPGEHSISYWSTLERAQIRFFGKQFA